MAEITKEKLTEALMLCTREIATCSAKTVTARAEADKQMYQQYYEGYKLLAELCKMALKGTVQTALTPSVRDAAARLAGLFGRRCRVVRNDYHFDGDTDKDYYIIWGHFGALNGEGTAPKDVLSADIGLQVSIARADQENINSYWTVNLSDIEIAEQEGAEDGRR